MEAMSAQVDQQPMAYTQFLMALDFVLGPAREIVVAGDPEDSATKELLAVVQQRFLPNRALLVKPGGFAGEQMAQLAPFTVEMQPAADGPAVYVCRDFACQRPVSEPKELEKALE